uniref:Lipoprotein n=1 Tax=Ascaris lumbricoides TaxID=6252 RepID=A0A0M3HP02_ASCLU
MFSMPFEGPLRKYGAEKKAYYYGPLLGGIDSFDTLAGLGLGKRSGEFEEATRMITNGGTSISRFRRHMRFPD